MPGVAVPGAIEPAPTPNSLASASARALRDVLRLVADRAAAEADVEGTRASGQTPRPTPQYQKTRRNEIFRRRSNG